MKTIILIFSILTAAIHAADALPDTSAIHRLKVYGKDGNFTATAFFIGPNRLLSAAHTFKKAQNPFIIVDGKEIAVRVIKIDYKSDVDCVLLETDYTSPTWYTISSGVVIAGFPHEFESLKQQEAGNLTKVVKTDNTIISGMSGSPLFINAVVIGMGVRCDWTKPDHSCESIQCNVLNEFLKGTEKR